MSNYLKLEDGSKVKFGEEVVFCSTTEAFDIKSGVRVGGLYVDGEWIDGDAFDDVEKLKGMEKVLNENGFINNENNIAIPNGEVATIKSYDHDVTLVSFRDDKIQMTLVSQFVSNKEEEWDILVEVV